MAEKNNSFALSFTDGKEYDIEEISNSILRNSKAELSLEVVDEDDETLEGQLTLDLNNIKNISAGLSDIKKYLYRQRRNLFRH